MVSVNRRFDRVRDLALWKLFGAARPWMCGEHRAPTLYGASAGQIHL